MDFDNNTPAKGDILIVDDDLSNLNTLSSMLTTEGYEVRGVPAGQMALTVIQNKPPELILLDVKMPGMDGLPGPQRKAERSGDKSMVNPLTLMDSISR